MWFKGANGQPCKSSSQINNFTVDMAEIKIEVKKQI